MRRARLAEGNARARRTHQRSRTFVVSVIALCLATPCLGAWLPSVTLEGAPSTSVPGSAGSIAVTSVGSAFAVWSDDETGRFQINVAFDTMGVWSPTAVLATPEGDALTPAICADSNGHVHLVWADDRSGDFEIYYREWLGAAWGPEVRLTTNASRAITPVVAARNGDVTVLWVDDRDGNTEIYARRRQNDTWGTETRVTTEAHDSLMPSADVGPDGVMHAVWVDNRSGSYMVYESTRFSTTWTAPLAVSSGAITTTDPHVGVSDDLSEHVVWIDYRSGVGSLYGRHKTLAGWGTIAALGLSSAAPDRVAFAGGPGAGAAVAWTEAIGGAPGVYTSSWNGAAWSPVATVASGSTARTLPAIGVSSTGDQVAMWADGATDVGLDVYAARNIVAMPVVQTVSPDSAMSGAGAHFTLTGSSFLGPDSVYVRDGNGAIIPALISQSRSFSVVEADFDLAIAAVGPADVIVRTSDGRRDTLFAAVHVTPPNGWSLDIPVGSAAAASYTNPSNGRSVAVGESDAVEMVWIDERGLFPQVALTEFTNGVIGTLTTLSNLTVSPLTPSIATVPGGKVEVVWRDGAPLMKDLYWRERTGGVWSSEVKITGGLYTASLPCVAGDPYTGDALLVYRMDIVANSEIYFKRLHNSVWLPETRLTVNTSTSTLPVCAAGAGGRVYVAWSDFRDGNPEIYFKQYDGIASWSADARLTTTTTTSTYPSIAVAPNGDVHVAWQDVGDNGSTEIYHRVLHAGAWGATTRVTTSTGSSVNPSIAVDGLGAAHLTWIDPAGTIAQVYYASYDGGAWSPPQQISRGPVGTQSPAVAVTASGSVHTVWTDLRGNQPTVYYATKRVIPTAIDDAPPPEGRVVTRFGVRAFPNPAHGVVRLALSLPQPARVDLEVLDVAGRLVSREDGALWESGDVTHTWIPEARVRPGVYYVRTRARFADGTAQETRLRVVLLR